jgi:hypothetical protein
MMMPYDRIRTLISVNSFFGVFFPYSVDIRSIVCIAIAVEK